MEFIKRHPARFLLILGLVMAAQSILWEYVRMKPDYRFIVTPWSIRGYDLTQGRIVTILAVGLLVLAVVAWRRFDETFKSIGLVVAVAVFAAAVGLAAVVNPEQNDYSLNEMGGYAAAAAIGVVLALLYRDLVAPRLGETLGARSGYLTLPIFVIMTLVVYFAVVKPRVVDDSVSLPLWAVVAIVLALLFVPALVSPPGELAVSRILILSVAGAWLVQVLSSGAIRSTLIGQQLEMGAAAQYKDTQITSGMMLAFFGFLLALGGAVALWAQRRDQIIARKRASQQREAARESMEELAPTA